MKQDEEIKEEKKSVFPVRRIVLFLGCVIIGFVVLCVILANQYLSAFSVSSGLSFNQLWALVTTTRNQQDHFNNKKLTFLILGLDKRNDEFEKTLLTDTIILASLNTDSGQLTMIPIPRDLWIPELHTKVNALYFYGEDRAGTTGPVFTAGEISRITGVPIDYYVVLNYQQLPELIDAVNGIEVTVEQSFTDDQFPNPRYIQEASESGEPIYISVSFHAGKQWMSGERALNYVRSRHSESEEGSDLARSRRQTAVVQALLSRLKQRETLLSPDTLGNVYQFWRNRIETNLADAEAGTLGLVTYNKQLSFSSVAIPTVSSQNQPALLLHPPTATYGQWVWEPRDKSWEELQTFIQNNL
ncbi:LCP family protein [Candidatus Roizmanbacteria bacterium]|nr:LCP family protein [Candidatus Roizmanbacteria bacterium]